MAPTLLRTYQWDHLKLYTLPMKNTVAVVEALRYPMIRGQIHEARGEPLPIRTKFRRRGKYKRRLRSLSRTVLPLPNDAAELGSGYFPHRAMVHRRRRAHHFARDALDLKTPRSILDFNPGRTAGRRASSTVRLGLTLRRLPGSRRRRTRWRVVKCSHEHVADERTSVIRIFGTMFSFESGHVYLYALDSNIKDAGMCRSSLPG
jgi:hypothetical protein